MKKIVIIFTLILLMGVSVAFLNPSEMKADVWSPPYPCNFGERLQFHQEKQARSRAGSSLDYTSKIYVGAPPGWALVSHKISIISRIGDARMEGPFKDYQGLEKSITADEVSELQKSMTSFVRRFNTTQAERDKIGRHLTDRFNHIRRLRNWANNNNYQIRYVLKARGQGLQFRTSSIKVAVDSEIICIGNTKAQNRYLGFLQEEIFNVVLPFNGICLRNPTNNTIKYQRKLWYETRKKSSFYEPQNFTLNAHKRRQHWKTMEPTDWNTYYYEVIFDSSFNDGYQEASFRLDPRRVRTKDDICSNGVRYKFVIEGSTIKIHKD